jgi:hypothetical protein
MRSEGHLVIVCDSSVDQRRSAFGCGAIFIAKRLVNPRSLSTGGVIRSKWKVDSFELVGLNWAAGIACNLCSNSANRMSVEVINDCQSSVQLLRDQLANLRSGARGGSDDRSNLAFQVVSKLQVFNSVEFRQVSEGYSTLEAILVGMCDSHARSIMRSIDPASCSIW